MFQLMSEPATFTNFETINLQFYGKNNEKDGKNMLGSLRRNKQTQFHRMFLTLFLPRMG